MPTYTFKAGPEHAGKRLDHVLCEFLQDAAPGISRTTLQKMIEAGHVSATTPGAPLKANRKVKEGEEFLISADEKKEHSLTREEIPLQILHEDKDVLVLNKQCGIVVHPAPGNYEHTLVNALLFHTKDLSSINPERPGIVHRLDKETSGVLVVAKNNASHLALAKQFADHSITRRYVALVKGSMEYDEGVVEVPIGRHPRRRMEMAAGIGLASKYAKTRYRTMARTPEMSLVELTPSTGRTHQLRVHMAFIGHPIMGDRTYGTYNEFPRVALHAAALGFTHPGTGKYVEFNVPPPPEFKV